MDNNVKIKRYAVLVIVALLLAVIDQITKYMVVSSIKLHDEIPVIGNAVVITYIRNTGTAWSLFSGKTVFLLIITFVVCAALIYVYKNIITEDKYAILRWLITAMFGGAIGNMIDRIRLHYVIDFIYFKIIKFPVFNFADICVTVSIFITLFLFIFKYEGEDLDIIFGSHTKEGKDS
ncbi:MAG: signal peptidase II [Eubacterium sp.]|nr:signal peptidase II [Eubacterium sp.]